MKNSRITERLAVVETLLKNHLKHHEMALKFVIFPILAGVVFLVIEKVWELLT